MSRLIRSGHSAACDQQGWHRSGLLISLQLHHTLPGAWGLPVSDETSVGGGRPPDRGSFDRLALTVVMGAVGVGLLVTIVFGPQTASVSTIASVAAFGVALAGASLLVGGLVGFLFGIPRRLQQEHAEAAKAPAGNEDEEEKASRHYALYGANTNLEQISDWLTKILVGVGLTQIGQIGTLLGSIGGFAAEAMPGVAAAKPFFIATTVHFSVCGFLLGYLWTRLYLGRALTEAERADSLEKKVDKYQKDVEAMRLATRQLAGDLGGRPVSFDDLAASIKSASPETRAFIFSRAQTQRYRNWRDNKRVMKRTIPIFEALIASDTDRDYHQNFGELGYTFKDQQAPNWKDAEAALSEAIRIRGDARQAGYYAYEFNRALCRIKLDPAFAHDPPAKTANEAASAIAADLEIAMEDEWVGKWVAGDMTIQAWLKLNRPDWVNPAHDRGRRAHPAARGDAS